MEKTLVSRNARARAVGARPANLPIVELGVPLPETTFSGLDPDRPDPVTARRLHEAAAAAGLALVGSPSGASSSGS